LVGSGLFGAVSYTVSQRRREIAIRMALGAGERTILGDVLKESMMLAGTGLALGIVGAVGLTLATQSLRFDSMLFGVNPREPATYAAAAVILISISIAASLVPAIRASHTAPTTALRE